MRLIFFGSGAFGLPTLRELADSHEIALVVTQPDRPAGRNRSMTPTPIAEFAAAKRIPIIKPVDVNIPEVIQAIHAAHADAYVVIAFGQKLSQRLLGESFAINLHGSLLPKYRGAAPIQWAMIHGEQETGVSVIALADRMDAGVVYATASVRIDPNETAGELHDRLAMLGPEVVQRVLEQFAANRLQPTEQDHHKASRAPKLDKKDGTVRFDQPASAVRNRIQGLTPWPGCTARLGGRTLRLHRVQVVDVNSQNNCAGEFTPDLTVACTPGTIRLLEVQPPGGTLMSFDAYRNGQPIRPGMKLEPL